ncbi:MAG: FAD binding domain-containing protein [Candidatus Bipolaricaulota bacterium]
MLGRFDYVSPATLDDAVRRLGPGVAILAGGTDLLVDLRAGRASPSLLVDIKHVDVLQRLEVSSARGIAVGAAVSLSRLVDTLRALGLASGLAEAASAIATVQLRHRATAVGNLCNASPAADLAPILLVLDAQVAVTGPRGERVLPLDGFFVGAKRTCLAADEIVTEIRIPKLDVDLRSAFRKQQRLRGHDLAVASAAAAFSASDGLLRVAIGSCAPTPLLLPPLRVGRSPEASVDEVVALASQSISPISDARSSAAYRAAVVPVLVRRAVLDVLKEGGRPSTP